jgi:hypothetical protein
MSSDKKESFWFDYKITLGGILQTIIIVITILGLLITMRDDIVENTQHRQNMVIHFTREDKIALELLKQKMDYIQESLELIRKDLEEFRKEGSD